jgi:hypothetical protein
MSPADRETESVQAVETRSEATTAYVAKRTKVRCSNCYDPDDPKLQQWAWGSFVRHKCNQRLLDQSRPGTNIDAHRTTTMKTAKQCHNANVLDDLEEKRLQGSEDLCIVIRKAQEHIYCSKETKLRCIHCYKVPNRKFGKDEIKRGTFIDHAKQCKSENSEEMTSEVILKLSDIDELENAFEKRKCNVSTAKTAKAAPTLQEVPARRADATDPTDSAPLATPNLEEAKRENIILLVDAVNQQVSDDTDEPDRIVEQDATDDDEEVEYEYEDEDEDMDVGLGNWEEGANTENDANFAHKFTHLNVDTSNDKEDVEHTGVATTKTTLEDPHPPPQEAPAKIAPKKKDKAPAMADPEKQTASYVCTHDAYEVDKSYSQFTSKQYFLPKGAQSGFACSLCFEELVNKTTLLKPSCVCVNYLHGCTHSVCWDCFEKEVNKAPNHRITRSRRAK